MIKCSSELFFNQNISGKIHSIFETSINLVYDSDKLISLLDQTRLLLPFSIIFNSRDFQRIKNIAQINSDFFLSKKTFQLKNIEFKTVNINQIKNSGEFDFDFIIKTIKEIYQMFSSSYNICFNAKSFDDLFEILKKKIENNSLINFLIGRGNGLTPTGDDIINGIIYFYNNCGIENDLIKIIEEIKKNDFKKTCLYSENMIKYGLENYYDEFFNKISEYSVSGKSELLKETILTKRGSSSGFDSLIGLTIFKII
ncbi:MAG TPA: DUF2877 domain-containing protein [bacterium]|nr:DUF2877 domain-containing protein [bacterium]